MAGRQRQAPSSQGPRPPAGWRRRPRYAVHRLPRRTRRTPPAEPSAVAAPRLAQPRPCNGRPGFSLPQPVHHDVGWRLIQPPAAPDRVPELPAAGPFPEGDLADELCTHPVGVRGVGVPAPPRNGEVFRGRASSCCLSSLSSRPLKPLPTRPTYRSFEPSGIPSSSEPTDCPRPPFPGPPAADHHLLGPLNLELEPGPAALADVAPVRALGHDALQPQLGDAFQDVRGVAVDQLGEFHRAAGRVKNASSRRRRLRSGRRRRSLPARRGGRTASAARASTPAPCDVGGLGELHPPLQQPEVGPPRRADGDDLAVGDEILFRPAGRGPSVPDTPRTCRCRSG